MRKQWLTSVLGGSKITADGDCSHEIKRCLLLGRKAMTNSHSILKSRDILCNKGLYSQSYGFFSSHVWMWELDHKENWVWKNWCFWTVVLERTLENSLDCKEILPVNPKGNQSWIFIGRTDADSEAPILWPPYMKSWEKKRLWCWERLKAEGEGNNRGWDGWMASPTGWTWIWANYRRWWRTGKPGVLQSMGSHRVGDDRATEQQQQQWITSLFNHSHKCSLGCWRLSALFLDFFCYE